VKATFFGDQPGLGQFDNRASSLRIYTQDPLPTGAPLPARRGSIRSPTLAAPSFALSATVLTSTYEFPFCYSIDFQFCSYGFLRSNVRMTRSALCELVLQLWSSSLRTLTTRNETRRKMLLSCFTDSHMSAVVGARRGTPTITLSLTMASIVLRVHFAYALALVFIAQQREDLIPIQVRSVAQATAALPQMPPVPKGEVWLYAQPNFSGQSFRSIISCADMKLMGCDDLISSVRCGSGKELHC
jgi:hypothetical protein